MEAVLELGLKICSWERELGRSDGSTTRWARVTSSPAMVERTFWSASLCSYLPRRWLRAQDFCADRNVQRIGLEINPCLGQ